jgi:hypothetical protein
MEVDMLARRGEHERMPNLNETVADLLSLENSGLDFSDTRVHGAARGYLLLFTGTTDISDERKRLADEFERQARDTVASQRISRLIRGGESAL